MSFWRTGERNQSFVLVKQKRYARYWSEWIMLYCFCKSKHAKLFKMRWKLLWKKEIFCFPMIVPVSGLCKIYAAAYLVCTCTMLKIHLDQGKTTTCRLYHEVWWPWLAAVSPSRLLMWSCRMDHRPLLQQATGKHINNALDVLDRQNNYPLHKVVIIFYKPK